MPSPFPGMDPYLEDPALWPDFHDRLAAGISTELNRLLPPPYYAVLQSRPELGIVFDESNRTVVPDVIVLRHPRRPTGAAAAVVLDPPRQEISAWVEPVVHAEPIRHHFVEIRDSKRDHQVVTLIEILSPSNKRPGRDRETYSVKQRDILASDTSLVEVDLLRTGERVLPNDAFAAAIRGLDPRPDYVVLVNCAWRRGSHSLGYRLFPFGLREWLPCIPVPLKENDPEITLDLQYVFNQAYEGGPYLRGAVDYTLPPNPPLAGADAEWAAQRVRAAGLIPAEDAPRAS